MKLLLVLLFLLSHSAWASDYIKIPYQVKSGDTFGKTLRLFVKDNLILNSKSPSIVETRKRNPQIATKEGWSTLKPGDKVDLVLEKSIVDRHKLKEYLDKKRNIYVNYPAEYVETSSEYKKFRGSIFYAASMGTFRQSSDIYPSVDFQQNSFLTLGASFSYFPKKSPWSYSFFGTSSKLKATGSNLNNENVSVPDELNLAFTAGYYVSQYETRFFGGVDYDSFSTFNLPGVEAEEKIYIDKNSVYFLTLGIAKNLQLFERSFYTRFSLSKSVMSDYTSKVDYPQDGKLDGYKCLLYSTFRLSPSFYLNASFQYNVMSSKDYDLNMYRLAFGVGYILF